MNNRTDNELCDSLILQLTTALHLNHFITIGWNQTLNRVIAQKANRFSINHYDHTVTRYMENSPYDDDPNINPQLTEKFFIKSVYFFHLDSTIKKIYRIIDHALTNTEACEPFFNKFNHFTLNFLAPKEKIFTARMKLC